MREGRAVAMAGAAWMEAAIGEEAETVEGREGMGEARQGTEEMQKRAMKAEASLLNLNQNQFPTHPQGDGHPPNLPRTHSHSLAAQRSAADQRQVCRAPIAALVLRAWCTTARLNAKESPS